MNERERIALLARIFGDAIGDDAAMLESGLVWTVDAKSHLEAMTAYWLHMGWGNYASDYPDIDSQTYASRGWE